MSGNSLILLKKSNTDLHSSEDLNLLVKRHIESVVARGPGRTISTLESDATELINTGMITLNAKLKGCEDENLLTRVVETWCFFWDQVLPYVEGVSTYAFIGDDGGCYSFFCFANVITGSPTPPDRPNAPQPFTYKTTATHDITSRHNTNNTYSFTLFLTCVVFYDAHHRRTYARVEGI